MSVDDTRVILSDVDPWPRRRRINIW